MSFSDLNIPASSSTVSVKVFDVVGDHSKVLVAAASFFQPVLPGHEGFNVPDFAFLVENTTTKTRVMFDLGVRKDQENAVPGIAEMYKAGKWAIPVDKDIVEQLTEDGVDLSSISAVIWSHSHVDHTGDMTKFPSSVDLVVSKDLSLETHQTNPYSHLLESDLIGHKLARLDIGASTLEIGGLKALDYFGDGSFYLLNVPGHQHGHISALARVGPTSFLLLGADACHHVGVLRPTAQLHRHFPCPGALVAAARTSVSHAHFPVPDADTSTDGAFDITARTEPFFKVAENGYFEDPKAATANLKKLEAFDAHPDVFVVIAHDESLMPIIGTFPATLDDWKEKGWKRDGTWAFLDEKNPAFRFNVKATQAYVIA